MLRVSRIGPEDALASLRAALCPLWRVISGYNKIPLVLGVTYFVLTFAIDWWHLNGATSLKTLLVIRSLGAFSVALSIGLLTDFLRKTDRSSHWLMAAWLVYLGILLAVVWPGLFTPDTRSVYMRAFKAPIDDWLGFFSPLFYAMVLHIAPHLAFVTIIQGVCCVVVLGLWDHVLRSNGANLWVRLLPQAFLALNVSFIYNVFLLNRDTLFAFSLCALLAFQVHIMLSRTPVSKSYFVGLGLAAAVLCALRFDGLAAVVITFAAIFICSRSSARGLVTSGIVFVCLFGLYVPVASLLLGRQSDRFGYAQSLVTNPLGYIINNGFKSDDPARDLAVIDKAFSVDLIRKLQKPDEIASYWAGGTRRDSTEEQRKAYFKTFFRLVWNNFDLFLQGRLITFMGSSGLNARNGAVVQKEYLDRVGPNGENFSGLAADYLFPQARAAFLAKVARTAEFKGFTLSGSALYWDFLPYLAVFIVLTILTPIVPVSGFASMVLVSRAGILFALAGGSQFIYYLPLVMGFPFVLAILCLEIAGRKVISNVAQA